MSKEKKRFKVESSAIKKTKILPYPKNCPPVACLYRFTNRDTNEKYTGVHKYKKGEINIDTLMNDIDSLSVMEEVYEARKIIEDANASDPKYVSGSGYGFFENNVVLSVPNKPIN